MHDYRREQLDRILASPQFAPSDRMSRFLRYVVEESIAGREALIKESTLGVDVFGKQPGYDAKADSTVRSEAVKVRARLAAYYAGPGRLDPWVLSIPKGSYVPVFDAQHPPDPLAQSPESVLADVPSSASVEPPRHMRWGWLAALAGVVGVSWMWTTRTPDPVHKTGSPVRLTWEKGLNTAPALSSEGKMLAYASTRSGDGWLDIWIRPVSRAAAVEPLRLTSGPADNTDPDISPQGDRLVFRSERDNGGIYMVSSTGGPDRLVVSGGRRPRFSPTAPGRITYYTGNPALFHSAIASGKIFVADVDGGTPPTQLAPAFNVALYPVWSPDGKDILFIGYPDKDYGWVKMDWWVTPADGSGSPRRVGFSEATRKFCSGQPQAPQAWSGITAIFHATCGDTTAIGAVTLKNGRILGEPSRLIPAGGDAESGVAMAANGLVAYVDRTAHVGIWSTSLHGLPTRTGKLTESDADEQYPSVTVDGTRLLFMSNRSGSPDVWLRDLTGKHPDRLVAGGRGSQTYPLLEPDEKHFVYSTLEKDPKDPVGWNTIVWRKPLEGESSAEKICEHCLYMGAAPTTGRILDLDGQPTFIATRDPAVNAWSPYLAKSGHEVMKATPSPDRKWIVFNVRRDERLFLFAAPFSAQGTGSEEWIEIAEGSMPVWDRAGSWLYFVAPQEAKLAIWRLQWDTKAGRASAGAKPELLVHFPKANEHLAPGVEVYRWMSASRTSLVYPVVETSSSIWIVQ